jgi:diguanylate cyclase (GGDEF)-like protein
MIKVENLNFNKDIPDNLERNRILKDMGRILKDSVREIDIACRYTNDRFVVIFPDASIHSIKSYVQEIIENFKEFTEEEGLKFQASVVQGNSGRDRHDLLMLAEAAIKQAQSEGKIIYYKE